jgi:hypothetical protein
MTINRFIECDQAGHVGEPIAVPVHLAEASNEEIRAWAESKGWQPVTDNDGGVSGDICPRCIEVTEGR